MIDYQDSLATGFWQTGVDIDFHFHFAYGGYAMMNKTVQDMVWSTRNIFYRDSRTEVTGAKISGPIDGYYGITCRYADGSNFYALVVGTDGFFGIAKKKAGKVTFLAEGYDKEGHVYTGGTPNLIRADCVGDTLTLWANGFMMAQVQDTDFSAGAVGLVVGDRAKGRYEVVFKDLSVYIPME